jgi:DNA-binding PadR family transcriptional regulator
MSTKHALLGLLLEGPAYPYQLADRLKARLGPGWNVNSGQVYKTIGDMEGEELIELVSGETEGRDERRRVYSITDVGVSEFERWLEARAGKVKLHRRPLLVKITLAGPERLGERLGEIDLYERECMARLQEFLDVRDHIPHEQTPVRADHMLLRVNLGADISVLESELQWARNAREMICWLVAQKKAIWPSRTGTDSAVPRKTRDGQSVRSELFDKMAAELEELGSK